MERLCYISYFLVAIGLSGYGFYRLTTLVLYLKHLKDVPTPLKYFSEEELPFITLQLPIFNEMHVIDRLVNHVRLIDYPKEKFQIQLLDDSTDETTHICQRQTSELHILGFDVEHLHRTDRTGFKAGALENGMATAKGELLFILDADFAPHPDILKKTVHFFTDPKVGLIQTRWTHLNQNFNLLTRIQAIFLDGHLEIEQTARNRSGRFFTFNGTGGMWRKSCIEDAGGWEHDTLTEDMDLSYRAQLKGWQFIYLKDVECPAELPVDMNGFKSQQHRWTKGSIQCCKKCLFNIWKSSQPMKVKLEATAHLTSNFAYLLLILLCFLIYPKSYTTLDWTLLQKDSWVELLISIPIFLFGSVSVILFYLVSQRSLHPKNWHKKVLYLPLVLSLAVGMSINNAKAVLEALFNHETGFVRTPKYGIGKHTKNSSTGSKYQLVKNWIPFVEILFAFFFLFIVLNNFFQKNYLSAVLLSTFPVGFFYTAISSFSQNIQLLRNKNNS